MWLAVRRPCPSLSSLSVMYHMRRRMHVSYEQDHVHLCQVYLSCTIWDIHIWDIHIMDIIYMRHTMSISMKSICDVCMCIRMYARICMHACMCVCMYVCMHACMHACMCVCVCACVTNKQINSRILQQRRHHDIDPTIALCPPCQQSYTKVV